jgi:pimeloyl-ACP methyl ester carboxylesterase
MAGKAKVWVTQSMPTLEVVKGALTQCDLAIYTHNLEQPGHMQATINWFATFPQDIKNDAVYQKTKLTMPVMAIGASNSLGNSVPNQVRQYATNVTGVVFPDSGHWIYEEHPAQSTKLLLGFLG